MEEADEDDEEEEDAEAEEEEEDDEQPRAPDDGVDLGAAGEEVLPPVTDKATNEWVLVQSSLRGLITDRSLLQPCGHVCERTYRGEVNIGGEA